MLSILIDRLIGRVAFALLGLAAMLTRPIGRGPLEFSVLALSALFIALLDGQVMAQGLQRLLRGSPRAVRADHRRYRRGAAPRCPGLAQHRVCLAAFGSDHRRRGRTIMLIAEVMPLTGPSAADYGIAGLYALIANSLPVTPGGLGIGEGAFASACIMLAPQAAHAAYGTIFLAFRCVFILSTLPGLAAHLTEP